jgi:peptide/nickel transport system substrate-binding protein
MQEQGVLIQPFWRSVFRHAADNVRGADAHPIFEHHHDKWWIAA